MILPCLCICPDTRRTSQKTTFMCEFAQFVLIHAISWHRREGETRKPRVDQPERNAFRIMR